MTNFYHFTDKPKLCQVSVKFLNNLYFPVTYDNDVPIHVIINE